MNICIIPHLYFTFFFLTKYFTYRRPFPYFNFYGLQKDHILLNFIGLPTIFLFLSHILFFLWLYLMAQNKK
jgi:hypothetical protein